MSIAEMEVMHKKQNAAHKLFVRFGISCPARSTPAKFFGRTPLVISRYLRSFSAIPNDIWTSRADEVEAQHPCV